MKSHDPDADLIREIQQGSREAFNDLVRRHHSVVCRLAHRMIDDPEDARDVAQEVFLQAYKVLPKWRFQAKFFSWLYQTTWNVTKSATRKKQRLYYREELPEQNGDESNETGLDVVLRSENTDMLKRLRSKLPKRQQQVILYRIYEKMSVSETAIVMRCKEGTVKALLFQAIKKLAALMKEEKGYEE